MRLFGPEPLTCARFTPSSRANFLTEGDACGKSRNGRLSSSKAWVGDTRGVWPASSADASSRGSDFSSCSTGLLSVSDDAFDALAGTSDDLAPPEPVTASSRISVPLLTLSPTFTFSDLTVPDSDDGISIEALSDSTVIRLCSASTESPSLTSTSMTSTSSKSPISGITTVAEPLAPDEACCAGSRSFRPESAVFESEAESAFGSSGSALGAFSASFLSAGFGACALSSSRMTDPS